jgi:hypothetical protein
MGIQCYLIFRVVDPRAEALSVAMRAIRSLGRERTDWEGNLVVNSHPYDFDESAPDKIVSDAEIERAFAGGEAFSIFFNRPGKYFDMDSISVLAEREGDVSKITFSTREAKYSTWDSGPLFAATMRAFADRWIRFQVEYEVG